MAYDVVIIGFDCIRWISDNKVLLCIRNAVLYISLSVMQA